MKKILTIFSCLCLMLLSVAGVKVAAEDTSDFETNSDYYYNLCAKSSLTSAEVATCKAFATWASGQSDDLRQALEDIERQIAEKKSDIAALAKQIQGFDQEISSLGSKITQLKMDIAAKEEEITVKQTEIDAKQAEIDKNQAEVDALMNKMKNRMVESQGTMRLNQYLDFIMGAKDFNELMRRMNGISDINSYDEKVHEEYEEMIIQLGLDKEALEVIKAELEEVKKGLEADKAEVEKAQQLIIVKRAEVEQVKEIYMQQEAALEEQGNKIAGDLQSIKDVLKNMSSEIGDIVASTGFTRPVSGGRISAGTWYYGGGWTGVNGGIHLGVDWAVPKGTTVRAAANGVVLASYSGCGDGGLGNRCGGGGTSGGGNQLMLLVHVDGTSYVVKYLHLLDKTLLPKGTIVQAGDKIAESGMSGNCTGPHVHVEVYRVGTMSMNDYIANWNGDLSFGCGWNTTAMKNRCSDHGAPCRERPEEIFGL